MVEIREESTEPSDRGASSSTSQRSDGSTPRPTPSSATLSQFVKEHTMDCVLFATRIFTIFFALSYILPFTSSNTQQSAYFKAFAAAAATNALRLQQRIGSVSFTREFFARLLLEDSCHYLFYCVLFLTSSPLTMALLPIVLFAALHSSNFFVTMMNTTGNGGNPLVQRVATFTSLQTQNCLGIIACSEIFLAPLLFSMIFMGKASLFTPFVFYRFLTLRYASRRNPYTRQAFYQMRVSLDQIAAQPACPTIVRTFVHKSISVISNLAPPV
ncbi:unnamed protein product, partial [Mesorhabditis belari]|uniref:Transmembrane protein 33 n=1 Tax=Mesorhabditis belari TaxID=2138241 RepID=A0AAF3EBG3_9BILA